MKRMNKREFSKLILAWELVVVTAVSIGGFVLAYLSIKSQFTGSLPWITAMVAPSWAAYGVSKAFYSDKAKAENKIKLPAYLERGKNGSPDFGSASSDGKK